LENTQDRIGISMTFKVGLANYSSADVQVSYVASAKDGETPDDLFNRVKTFVEVRLEESKTLLLKDAPRDSKKQSQSDRVDEEETENTPKKKPLSLGGGFSRLKISGKKKEEPKEEESEEESEPKTIKAKSQVDEHKEDEGHSEVEMKTQSTIEAIKAKYMGKTTEGSLVSNLKR
jgi:hypothetical protein